MDDLRELVDIAADIIALLKVGELAYAIYRNRDKLKQKLKSRRVHDVYISAQSKAVASLTATPRVSREPPSALFGG
jgi:hypothetical protein